MGKEIVSRTTVIKGVTACVVVAASLGIIQIGEYSINSSEDTTTASSSTGTMSYTPGTYTASSAGISSDVTVTCTFDESSITAITVDVSGETAGIGADIGDEMIEQFMAAQSASVDGVTSATITSNALKAALEDCIAQATGESGSSDDTDEAESETEAETEASSEAISEEVTEIQSEEGTDNEEADEEASVSSEVIYTPGTYTASATGMESDVTVSITVDESSILSITCDVSGETAGIGADIGDEIIEQILSAQSADVDGVSGATVTSTAVRTATADALAQASDSASVSESDVASDETEGQADEVDTESESDEASAVSAEAETEAESEIESEVETETESEVETETETETEAEATASSGEFVPGTYTASSAGISSDVTVTCTFDETGLVDITADVSGETAGIGADIGDEMIAKVLEAQSAEVDGVTGATITSNAFLTAVADCMEQAGFTGAVVSEDETETEAESEIESEVETETETESEIETEEVTEADTEIETEEVTEADTEIETEEVTETDTEGETVTEADTEMEADESSARFAPGVYSASAEGISSTVTVTIIVDEDSILSIGYDLSGESADIGAKIGPDISRQILNAQSAEVNGISGATITSDAFKSALAECIALAESAAKDSADITDAEEQTDEAALEDKDSDAEDSENASGLVTTYNAGIYTSSAQGISSEVTVTVAFDDESMVSIGYDLSGETAGIGADIGPEISGQILTAQSVDVDGVTGATITSNAVKEAIAACIAQAKN